MNIINIKSRLSQLFENSNLIRSFIATLLGSGFSKIILALATFVFANELSKTEFGEFSFIRNTLNTILCMCALNFMSLCTKFTVESEKSDTSFKRLAILFIFSISVCFFVGLTILIIPNTLMEDVLGSYQIVYYFRFIGLLLPLFMFQPLLEGMLRGLMKFKLIGILQTIMAIIFVVVVYLGIKIGRLGGAVCGILIYYTAYSFLSILIAFRLNLFSGIKSKISGIWDEIGVLKKMILPVFLMSFFEAPILWIAQVLLSKFDSMESVGSMTAIYQIRNIIILIPTYLFNTFVAFAGKMNSNGDFSAYFLKFSQLSKLLFLIGIFAAVICSVFACPILGLYGDSYKSDYIPLIISNFEIPLLLLIGLWKIDLVIQEHQNHLLYSSIGWNLLWIVLFSLFLNLEYEPLLSFFLTQIISVFVYTVWIYNIFNKDKNKLLYER